MNQDWSDTQIAALKKMGVTPDHVRIAIERTRPKTRVAMPRPKSIPAMLGSGMKMADGGDVDAMAAQSKPTVQINLGQPQGNALPPPPNFNAPLPDPRLETQAQDLAMSMGNIPAPQRMPAARQQVSSRVQAGQTPVPSGPANIIPGEGRLEPSGSQNTAGVRLPAAPSTTATDATGAVFAGGAPPSGVSGPQIAGLFSNAMAGGVEKPAAINPAPLMQAQTELGGAQAQQATQVAAAQNAAKNDLQAFDLGYEQDAGKRLADINTAVQTAARNPVKDWTTGDRIMAGIAIALGGAASSKTGQNTALNIINQNIDREITLRKDKVDQLRGEFGDFNTAQSALRASLWNQVSMDVEAVKNSAANPVYKANAEMLGQSAKIEAQKANNDANLRYEQIVTDRQNRYAQLMMLYGQRIVPDGETMHIAPSDQEAVTGRQFMQKRKEIVQNVQQLQQLTASGRLNPYGKSYADAQQLYAGIVSDIMGLDGFGKRFMDSEIKYLGQQVANPGNLMQVNPAAAHEKLKNLLRMIERKKDSIFEAWGQGGAAVPAYSPGSGAIRVGAR